VQGDPAVGAAAALTAYVPLGNSRAATGVYPPSAGERQSRRATVQEVSSGYFAVLRIPVVAGRTFAAADEGRRTILINDRLARWFWPASSPLGQPLVVDGGESQEVIGVVRDAYTTDLEPIEPTVYRPLVTGRAALLVRSPDPGQTGAMVRTLVEKRDPRAQASSYPLARNVARAFRAAGTGAALAAGLGLLALVLAAVGVFGVAAYAVEQRTREIGVRMALGASRGQVVRFVLAANSRAVLVGLAVGLVVSFLSSRLLESHLFGVSRLDPVAHGAVLALLACTGLVATLVPARRATRVDPLLALRAE
jgi:putative ABC transport system permease protein